MTTPFRNLFATAALLFGASTVFADPAPAAAPTWDEAIQARYSNHVSGYYPLQQMGLMGNTINSLRLQLGKLPLTLQEDGRALTDDLSKVMADLDQIGPKKDKDATIRTNLLNLKQSLDPLQEKMNSFIQRDCPNATGNQRNIWCFHLNEFQWDFARFEEIVLDAELARRANP